ncbi:MAG: hypothetical protein RR740_00635 [Pseudomonas sp.]
MAAAHKKQPVVVDIRSTAVKAVVTFDELWVGDRFQPAYAAGEDQPIYTKLRHDQARCHSLETTMLREAGFGQLDDPIVKVNANEKVRFIPV